MRNKIVMGNWKMNGSLGQVDRLLNDLLTLLPKAAKPACVVFPPSIYLPRTCELLTDSQLMWGAQNVYPRDCGAYTGELSAPMLMDYDCRYVLVGHSERRSLCHEDEKFVAEKFHHAKEHGMIPVLCIGETLEARDQGLTEHVLEQQLSAVIKTGQSCFDHCVLAYEPVWAIGTGQTATPDQVQAVHSFIRRYVAEFDRNHAEQMQIVYGGSVSEKNAQAIFAMPDVDGGLVGGASLNAQQFVEIVKCINCY